MAVVEQLDHLEPEERDRVYRMLNLKVLADRTATWRSSGLSAGAFVEITNLYLLIVPALGTGERTYFSRTVCRDDGGLVPVEDVAARLASLPERNDRASLVDDLAACHLYGHPTSARKTRLHPNCMPTPPFTSEIIRPVRITPETCSLKPTARIACARAGVPVL